MDLVGKLHRCVYVIEVPSHLQEEFAQLLAKRCGEVEQWARDDETITVVFREMGSVATAISLNGLRFCGYSPVIWVANKPKPQAVLAIEAAKQPPGESEPSSRQAPDASVSLFQQLKEQQKLAAQSKLASQPLSNGRFTMMTAEEKDAFMGEHGLRQAVALTYLANVWIEIQEAEIQRLQSEISLLRNVAPKGVSAGICTLEIPSSARGTKRLRDDGSH